METQVEKNVTASDESAGRGGLVRRLGLMSAIAVLVGSTIGTGIFRSPAGIAARVPDEGWYLLLWVLGGFFTLCGALTLAELAAALPRTGGIFAFLREGWGRLPAFLFGWSELVIIRASALGAISTVFAEYFLRLLNYPITIIVQTAEGPVQQSSPTVHYVAAGAILTVAVFNILGVQLGALVQNITTGAKYAALVVLVLAAFIVGGNNPAQIEIQRTPTTDPISPIIFGLAFISLLWVYDGWADVTFVGGEVKRPERFLPFALIFGTLAVIAIYLLANLAYLHLLDINQIANSRLVAADVAYRIVGDVGVKLVSIAVMISAFGTLNGSMMTGPRIFFAMADDGLFFKKIAAVHPRFKTPYVAISLAATLAILFVMVRTFEQLADTFVLAIWPFYAAGVAAVYALRRKRPDLPRPYRTLGYPVTPALFIIAVAILIGNALINDFNNLGNYRLLFSGQSPPSDWSAALMVFSIILLGIPAYLIWKATHSRRD
ncbi:MAG TPA: amino acid permease [Blastocatellia bacterium]|nr:amino acid permease [Blastocatellia bacterium]